MSEESRSQKYHNQGEKDRSEGKGYNPPHTRDPVTDLFFTKDWEIQDQKDYRAGYENTDTQIKENGKK